MSSHIKNPDRGSPVGEVGDDEFLARFQSPITTGNIIRDINPINMFVMLSSVAMAALVLPGLIWPTLVCFAWIVVAFAAGVGKSFVSVYWKLFAVVGLILFSLRALFVSGGEEIASLGPLSVTTGGVLVGLHFTLVVMALSGAVVLLFALTPMKNLMLALESRGVTPRVTYIVLASFQSIKDLGQNSRTVMDAQRSRGIETEGSIFTRIRAFVPILAPVFLAAMNQTEERAIALDARAFNSKTKHTHLARLKPIPVAETVLTWAIFLISVLAVSGAVFIWH